MKSDANLTLIGMPAAGKSTIGIILAKTLGMPFIDTDILIQTRAGQLLQQIIDRKGIEYFLNLEEKIICSLQLQGHIIATGGSVVYGAKAMTRLKENSLVVYLKISYPEMVRRLQNIATRGVVIRRGQNLGELYNERAVLYEQYADKVVDGNDAQPEMVVTRISALFQEVSGNSLYLPGKMF